MWQAPTLMEASIRQGDPVSPVIVGFVIGFLIYRINHPEKEHKVVPFWYVGDSPIKVPRSNVSEISSSNFMMIMGKWLVFGRV